MDTKKNFMRNKASSTSYASKVVSKSRMTMMRMEVQMEMNMVITMKTIINILLKTMM